LIFIVISLILTLTLIYCIRSHPVLFTSIILIQTILLRTTMWISQANRWFAFILFLIFLGGLIVLFVYITRLASNELISTRAFLLTAILLTVSVIVLFIHEKQKNLRSFINTPLDYKLLFTGLYSTSSMTLVLLRIIYLLITLIVTIKTANKNEAPIKTSIK